MSTLQNHRFYDEDLKQFLKHYNTIEAQKFILDEKIDSTLLNNDL
jgi:hypothetical protein